MLYILTYIMLYVIYTFSKPFLKVYESETKDILGWSILVNLISFYINFHTFAYFLAMILYYFHKDIRVLNEYIHISD